MEPTAEPDKVFQFGLFQAEMRSNTLTRNGVRVKVQDQPFQLLTILLQRPGEVVTREELKQRLWSQGTYVDFDGSLNVILKRLRAALDDDPENPRFIATVPKRGYRFIAPVSVVEKIPEAVLSAKLEDVTTPLERPVRTPDEVTSISVRGESLHRQFPIYAASVAILLLLAVIGTLAWHYGWASGQSLAFTSSSHMRKSVAVLGFQNLSGRAEDAWLGTALSEMLSTELAGGEKLRLISGEDVANLRVASPWSQTDTLDRGTTARIGTALNSDVLVLGSYLTIGASDHGQLRLDVRMQDGKTGEILTEVAEVGSAEDIFRLVSRVGVKLRDRLGVEELRGADEAGVIASLPLDPEAARFYALGITKLRQFDALAAKDLLQQAAAVDPNFSLVHSMLATAWAQLGYEDKRKAEAKRALDLSVDLPRAQRMLVEGEYYESIGNQDQAASTYHALFELFPDNLEYGLRLIEVQIRLGRGSQATQVIQQLRRLPSPSSDDPRIDLAEARSMKDNKPGALVLVRRAMRKASSRGQTLIYALARKEECMNLLYGEQPAEAGPACEDAHNTFLAAGNRMGAADALRLRADLSGTQGHYEEAIATYGQALSLLQGLGEHEKTAAILNNMAINFANEGKLDRAEQLYREAQQDFEFAGNKINTAATMVNLADIFYARGRLTEAARQYQDTLNLIAGIEHGEPGYALCRMADLQLAEGNTEDAKRFAQKSIESIRPVAGGYQYLSNAITELGAALEAQGDLAGASSQFQQALAMRQKMGALELVAESQVELADLAIAAGHPQEADPLLRSAIGEFDKEKNDPGSSSANALLSRVLLMEGNLDEARRAAQRALELSQTSADPALRLPAEIQQARIEMASTASASSTGASQQLQAVISSAKRLGYYDIECEARLALGELEMKTNASLAHRQLTALASEAHSRGLELLAHQAQGAIASGVLAENRSGH